MGKVRKNIPCSVRGCNEPAAHSVGVIDTNILKSSGLDIESPERGIYLCEKHYKMYKKARRRIDRLLRWRFKK